MKKLEADVIVIAAGPAGLAAAIAAAEKGASVIVLEKAKATGGTGNMGMGPFGVETKLQRQKLIGLTKEEAFKKFMDYTHYRVDARLVKAYINKSPDTIAWLQDMGVEFFDVVKYFPSSEATWHIVKPATGMPGPRAAAIMFKLMADRATELGVEFYLETTAKKIIMEDGQAVGVLAESAAGESIEAYGGAVIVATGGFGDNPEMIKKYMGYEWGKDIFSFRIPGLFGEGLKMAWEAGAGEDLMTMEMIYSVPMIQDSEMTDQMFRQPSNLIVNLSGDRIFNEELLENTTFAGNALSRQKNKCAFSIFDSSALKNFRKNGFDLASMVHPFVHLDKFEAQMQQFIDEGNTDLFVCNSIEEIAEKTGIDYEALKNTIEEYNKSCGKNYDELFDKNRKFLKPIDKAPYYVGRLLPGAYGTMGGIKVNHKLEVLTPDFDVIPGLYSAGVDACSIFGDSYVFVLPGNTMGFCLNSGRIAGENAAEYANG
ncbi:MAG: FAD-binding protein [Clostridiales bacterium]|nr:FAD-binding protein [Clostridiales bacterium]